MIDHIWRVKGVPHTSLPQFGGNMNRTYDSREDLHRFYLACCRSIWPLLPQEPSRKGIELSEQWLEGDVSNEELNKFNYYVEGAAFNIDYNVEPDKIDEWIANLRKNDSYRHLLFPPEAADQVTPRELLKRAAYFADYAMVYPSLKPVGNPPETYRIFLSPELLRKFVSYGNTTNAG